MQSSYDSKIASSQQDSNSRLKGRDAGETARSISARRYRGVRLQLRSRYANSAAVEGLKAAHVKHESLLLRASPLPSYLRFTATLVIKGSG